MNEILKYKKLGLKPLPEIYNKKIKRINHLTGNIDEVTIQSAIIDAGAFRDDYFVIDLILSNIPVHSYNYCYLLEER